ncbi:hypothetical protein ODE01S_00430 [Oceanithermus desulfurans NBRC 100063]|uniref:Uncharacterized protein n=1 Tax=Oceanithermus desulfurans NBRC 100063 TaxID=1227550 RepID=A0A511RG38_9DEIN|nr:hypothetical protein ODE01S_00430 [Oceanithermus desulfurans NBRC 100063]
MTNGSNGVKAAPSPNHRPGPGPSFRWGDDGTPTYEAVSGRRGVQEGQSASVPVKRCTPVRALCSGAVAGELASRAGRLSSIPNPGPVN